LSGTIASPLWWWWWWWSSLTP